MQMPGRNGQTGDYRYQFNGKETDNEIKGSGNSYDFGARMYDPRIGRWLSRDPRAHDYVPLSPYNFGLNNPIYFIDADGEVIIDANGNEVTVEQDSEGNVTGFSADIAPQTRELLDYYLKSDVGKTQLKKMDATVTEITVVESQKAAFKYGDGQYSLISGITLPGRGKAKEADGTETYKSAEIILFKGSYDILVNGEDAINDDEKYTVYDGSGPMDEKGKIIKKGGVAIANDDPGSVQKDFAKSQENFNEYTLVHESAHTESEDYEMKKSNENVEPRAREKETQLYNEKTGN
jgi:RHS repeat-associated protein